ncbi:MAG: hypothetical protein MJ166_01680 [Clostridia bacterium]|nr:hypothetical protein [Clostridia bacterium]
MKRVISLLLVGLMIISLSGCNEKTDKSTKSTQKKAKKEIVVDDDNGDIFEYSSEDGYLNYVIYDGDTLTINSDVISFENYSCSCYDMNFDAVYDVSYEVEGDNLIITSDDASNITGISLDSDYSRFEIRYLNSDEYAFMYFTWADDIGYILSGGDRDKYYTKEEIYEMDQKKLDAIRKQEETFLYFEGEWISEDDGLVNLSFYIDDNGNKRIRCYANDLIIGSINLYERNDYEDLCVCDDPSWGCMLDFKYYRDTDTLEYCGTEFVRAN